MSKNIKFYLIATAIFTILFFLWLVIGFWIAAHSAIDFLNIHPVDKDDLGLLNLLIAYTGAIGGGIGGFFGFILAFIFIRRLGRRWGSQLNFGAHPVLKLTVLAFITFAIIALVLLTLYAYG